MQFIKQITLIASLAFPAAALAHGGGEHLMGTVKTVDEKGLTVETKEKKEVKVVFDDKTKFEKDGAASSAKELSAGTRVVVHTTKKQDVNKPVAVLVKFGSKGVEHTKHAEHEHHAARSVALSVTDQGFTPDHVKVRQGEPVDIVITRKTDKTCATAINIPDYGIKRDLPLNEAVTVSLTPKKSGEIKYSCGMGRDGDAWRRPLRGVAPMGPRGGPTRRSTLHLMASALGPWLRAALLVVLLAGGAKGWAAPADAAKPSEQPTDPVLKGLIDESLAALPELARARATAKAERERVSQVGALPDPMLQLGVQNDGFTSWQVGKMETSWYSVMASQTFPWPGKLRLRSEVAEFAASQADQSTARLRLSTEADVRRAYLSLLLARDHLALLDRLEAISQKSVTAARTRYEAGTGAQSDLLRAQLELTRIKQRRWTIEVQVDTAQQALNRLRGHPLDEPIEPPVHLADLSLPALPDEAAALQDALDRSPELAAARLGVTEGERSLSLARKSYLPDFTVSAGVMPRGGDFPPMWLVSVGGTLPVFAGSKQSRAVVESEARVAAGASNVQALEQVLRLRARQRVTALRATLETIRLYRDGLLVQSEATAESTRAQYEVGKVTFASVLEANAGFIADEDGFLQVLTQAQVLAIDAAEVSLTPPQAQGAAMGAVAVPGTAAIDLSTPSSGLGSTVPNSAAGTSASMSSM